jgi:2-polyprenyl-6-methoxyphenol hydroxylase-like FAD-dependent oxidoreductase
MLVVVGGGIGGLSFAISRVAALRAEGRACSSDNLLVVERASGPTFTHTAAFSHPVVVEARLGGIEALEDLGVLDEVAAMQTASCATFTSRTTDHDVYVAHVSEWTGPRTSIRVTYGDLWRALYHRAKELGVVVRFGATVVSIEQATDGSRHKILLASQHGRTPSSSVEADQVVLAAGAATTLLNAQPSGSQRYVAMGGPAVVTDYWPPYLQGRDGVYFTDSGACSAMASHEHSNNVMVGIAFPVDAPIDPSDPETMADLHVRAATLAHAHLPPSLATLLIDQVLSADGGALFVVNGAERVPTDCGAWQTGVLRLGDAWHADSPYSMAGATMALVDGVRLGPVAGTAACSATVDKLASRWRSESRRQRLLLSLAHGTSWPHVALRSTLLRVMPLTSDPSLTWLRWSLATVAVGVVASLVISRTSR